MAIQSAILAGNIIIDSTTTTTTTTIYPKNDSEEEEKCLQVGDGNNNTDNHHHHDNDKTAAATNGNNEEKGGGGSDSGDGGAGGGDKIQVWKHKSNRRDLLTLMDPLCEKASVLLIKVVLLVGFPPSHTLYYPPHLLVSPLTHFPSSCTYPCSSLLLSSGTHYFDSFFCVVVDCAILIPQNDMTIVLKKTQNKHYYCMTDDDDGDFYRQYERRC